jgi:hypothetical protein
MSNYHLMHGWMRLYHDDHISQNHRYLQSIPGFSLLLTTTFVKSPQQLQLAANLRRTVLIPEAGDGAMRKNEKGEKCLASCTLYGKSHATYQSNVFKEYLYRILDL